MNPVARVALTIAPVLALFAAPLAAPVHIVATQFSESLVPASHDVEASGREDRYGNEVISAVPTYKLDKTGCLYEVHAPQMELPLLPSPEG